MKELIFTKREKFDLKIQKKTKEKKEKKLKVGKSPTTACHTNTSPFL